MKLKNYQRRQIQDWFCPSPGYVLDFSNATFKEFFEDHFDLNIYADAFSEHGTSKFNRLLSFVELSPPHVVIELLNLLWSRRNSQRDEEIAEAYQKLASDVWNVSEELIEAMESAARIDDEPFSKLLQEIGSLPSHVGAPHVERISAHWTLDTVQREFARAFEATEADPESAITAASSMIESLCKSILVARSIPFPAKQTIQNLYKEVREPLGLSPDKAISNREIEADIRSILSAISGAVQGIGALRTHAGSAHGREKGFRRIDPRIARLSVGAATTLALFIMETWEKQYPGDRLMRTK